MRGSGWRVILVGVTVPDRIRPAFNSPLCPGFVPRSDKRAGWWWERAGAAVLDKLRHHSQDRLAIVWLARFSGLNLTNRLTNSSQNSIDLQPRLEWIVVPTCGALP